MNGLGVALIIIALSLLGGYLGGTWRAERRYMRNIRQQNKRESIKALIKNWERKIL